MHIRPFRNSDPPALVKLWGRLPPLDVRVQHVTLSVLEQHVFTKPYFDREGFLVAEEAGELIGFVHASFGAQADHTRIDPTLGVISMLAVAADAHGESAANALVRAAESYLASNGASHAIAGGVSPHHPFYLGMYGGALLPGITESDRWTLDWFTQHGYESAGARHLCRRSLFGFRAPVDRDLMRVRRAYRLEYNDAPIPDTWWDACTLGPLNRRRFELIPRSAGDRIWVDVWDMEPLASSRGWHAMGVCNWSCALTPDSVMPFTFLLGETMRMLSAEGIGVFELQYDPRHREYGEICARLGLETTDQGHVLKKQLVSP